MLGLLDRQSTSILFGVICRTNLPKEIFNFPGFPYPSHLPSFPGHHDILKYLQQYADHFDLTQHIRFRTLVEQVISVPKEEVNLEGNGKSETSKDDRSQEWKCFSDSNVLWRVTTQNLESGERTSEDYDGIMVCNGYVNHVLIIFDYYDEYYYFDYYCYSQPLF